jgi:hypothetical protein
MPPLPPPPGIAGASFLSSGISETSASVVRSREALLPEVLAIAGSGEHRSLVAQKGKKEMIDVNQLQWSPG